LERVSQMVQAARLGLRGERPARYDDFPFTDGFYDTTQSLVRPAIRVLDVGSGATPTLRTEWRPKGLEYVGLDVSADELSRAAPGAYDRTVVGDVARFDPELREGFDLVLSVNTLEHVSPLDDAVENLRQYLKPGGTLVAQFSGAFALFALVNRAIPERLKERLVLRLTGRPPDDVFPARYHLCWDRALRRRVFARWRETSITPLYLGADYVDFSSWLRAGYLGYEEWACRGGHANLATHYRVTARR
jgi:SAM-dependent methyltransferase